MANKIVRLKDGNDVLVPKVAPTIDTSNLIADISIGANLTWTYTFPQDAYITFYQTSSAAHTVSREFTINGNKTDINISVYGPSGHDSCAFLFKKGDTLSIDIRDGTTLHARVYGIRYAF